MFLLPLASPTGVQAANAAGKAYKANKEVGNPAGAIGSYAISY